MVCSILKDEERDNVKYEQHRLIRVEAENAIKAQNSFSDRIRNVYDIIMHIYKELDEEESVMFHSLMMKEKSKSTKFETNYSASA